jgi:NhaP-type Na+/H+ or K+/H+ antiporter
MFWVLMIIARGLMVFMFLPLLKYFGYGMNKAEMWVLIWGGLRGALGLTLALMVAVDEDLLDEEMYPRGKRLR